MFTLVDEAVFEEEIKKSRFIAKATSVNSSEEAFSFLERIREERATHNCWAYHIEQSYRFSDDGEPGGTAGKPILNAIQRQSIDRVMVVVVRYFGGVKLGAGGLVRAYGGCAAKCLQTASLRRIVPTIKVRMNVGFDHIGSVYPIINQFRATKLSENYSQSGLEIKLKIRPADVQAFSVKLRDASAGQIKLMEE